MDMASECSFQGPTCCRVASPSAEDLEFGAVGAVRLQDQAEEA